MPTRTSFADDVQEASKEAEGSTVTLNDFDLSGIEDKGVIQTLIDWAKAVGNTLLIKTTEGIIEGSTKAINEAFNLEPSKDSETKVPLTGGGLNSKIKNIINAFKKAKKSIKGGAEVTRTTKAPDANVPASDAVVNDTIDAIANASGEIEINAEDLAKAIQDDGVSGALKKFAVGAGTFLLVKLGNHIIKLGSEAILGLLKGGAEQIFLFLARMMVGGAKNPTPAKLAKIKVMKAGKLTSAAAKKIANVFRKKGKGLVKKKKPISDKKPLKGKGLIETDELLTSTVKSDGNTNLKGALTMDNMSGGALFKNAVKGPSNLRREPRGGKFSEKIRRTRKMIGRKRLG